MLVSSSNEKTKLFVFEVETNKYRKPAWNNTGDRDRCGFGFQLWRITRKHLDGNLFPPIRQVGHQSFPQCGLTSCLSRFSFHLYEINRTSSLGDRKIVTVTCMHLKACNFTTENVICSHLCARENFVYL